MGQNKAVVRSIDLNEIAKSKLIVMYDVRNIQNKQNKMHEKYYVCKSILLLFLFHVEPNPFD